MRSKWQNTIFDCLPVCISIHMRETLSSRILESQLKDWMVWIFTIYCIIKAVFSTSIFNFIQDFQTEYKIAYILLLADTKLFTTTLQDCYPEIPGPRFTWENITNSSSSLANSGNIFSSRIAKLYSNSSKLAVKSKEHLECVPASPPETMGTYMNL